MLRFLLKLRSLRDRLSARVSAAKMHHPKRGVGVLFVSVLMAVLAQPAHAQSNMDSLMEMMADWAFNIASIMTSLIVLVIDAMVPILTYNRFTNNPVVSQGWAIVRDTVNMFFVVVLIVIAFGTIFGHSKFKWEQQVPKLMIFALVINFSKTLCGIMIDFGQVIMLTFANALREIAAGNIIQLFGLNQLYTISNAPIKKGLEAGGAGSLDSFDFLLAGFASVVMTVMVLGSLMILTAVLLFRIIMLWILVVISPLAWFVGGTGKLTGSGAYETWWKEFKCLVAVGPVLTFFLWLTLAVAGSGGIAESSGFDVAKGQNSAGIASSLFELHNFMGFLIGIAMIFAGFDAAKQMCEGAKGGSFLAAAKKAPAALGRAGVALGVAGGGLALRGAGTAASLSARGTMGAAGLAAGAAKMAPGSAAIAGGVRDLATGAKKSAWGAVEGLGKKTGLRSLERAGLQGAQSSKDAAGVSRMEGVSAQADKMKKMSREGKVGLAKQYADQVARGDNLSVNEQAQKTALFEEMMGDSRMQKDLGQDVVRTMYEQDGERYGQDVSHDAAKTGKLEGFRKANAHYSGIDMNKIESWDDAKNLSDAALQDSKVQEHLKGIGSSHTDKDKNPLSAYDAIVQGREGNRKQGAIGLDPGARYAAMSPDELSRVSPGEIGKAGSVLALGQAVQGAAARGDGDRVKDMLDQMKTRYLDAGSSDEERIEILDQLEGLEPDLKRGDGVWKSMRGESKTGKHLDNTMKGISRGRGGPPPIVPFNEGMDGKEFAQGFSKDHTRRENQKSSLRGLAKSKGSELTALEGERDGISEIFGPEREAINTQMQAAAANIQVARGAAQKQLRQETEKTRQEFQKAYQKLQSVLSDPASTDAQKTSAKESSDSALVAHTQSARASKIGTAENRKAVASNSQVKKMEEAFDEVESERKELDEMVENSDEYKKVMRRIEATREHIKQAEEALKAFK